MTALARPPRAVSAQPTATQPARTPHAGTVLIVSHVFPPSGGPGVQRSAKFAKYLPQFGWTPIVAAARALPELPRDASLEADLPAGLRVHRSAHWDPTAWLAAKRLAGEGPLTGIAWRLARINRTLRYAILPDPAVGWALANLLPCLRLLTAERVDVIYSTYSPGSNHLLAWCLHAMTGTRWVADFRDLWTDDYNYPHRGTWRAGIDRRLERSWVRAADAVLGVTDGQVEVLRRHAPDQPDKFRTITNGVDLDDFTRQNTPDSHASSPTPSDVFTLTFTGWFLSDRVPSALIDALVEFNTWVTKQDSSWRFRIVGTIADRVQQRIRDVGIPLDAPGYVSHSEVTRHMTGASVLLLLIPGGPNGRTLMTGKVFEYLAARRPILGISGSPGAEAAQLIDRHRAGTVVPDDVGSITRTLRELWQKWHTGDLRVAHTDADLESVSRCATGAQLANVLDGIKAGSLASTAPIA